MAEPQPSQEAVIRAAVVAEVENPAGRGKLTNSQEAANAIRTQYQKEGEDKTLVGFVDRSPKKHETIDFLDENLSATINPDTGERKRTREEQSVFNNAEAEITTLYDYLEKGDFTDAAKKADVMVQIGDVLKLYPGASEALKDLNMNDIADKILKNPDFQKAIQDRLTEIKAKRVSEIDPGAENAYKEAKRAEKDKERERDRAKGELEEVEKGLKQFERTASGTGKLAGELDKIKEDLPQLKLDADRAGKELRGIERQIKALERQYEGIVEGRLRVEKAPEVLEKTEDALAKLESDKEEKQKVIDEKTKAENRKTELQEEKASLEERRSELLPNRDKIEGELEAVVDRRIQAQAALVKAQRARGAQEREIVMSIEEIYKDAAVKYFDGKLEQAEGAQRAVIAEQIGKAKDALERQMIEKLSGKLWDQEKTIPRGIFRPERKTVLPNKGMVDIDYVAMLRDGPETAMIDALKRSGLSASEIDEKMKDPQFKAEKQRLFVEQLLMRKIKTGKITEDEAFLIGTSPWGADVINTALAKNAAVRSSVDQLRGAGILMGNSAAEWIRSHPGKSFAGALITALLGGVAGAAALSGWAAIGAGTAAVGAAGASGAGIKHLQRH